MFPEKGFFTAMGGSGCIKYCYSNLGAIYAKGLWNIDSRVKEDN